MAKGARASTRKANNAKLKSKVFGPIETARTERLSAKLLELASQPKPEPAKKDVTMELDDENPANEKTLPVSEDDQTEGMEIDQKPASSSSKPSRGRIQKRKSSRKASIVFPKYKNGQKVGKQKGKK